MLFVYASRSSATSIFSNMIILFFFFFNDTATTEIYTLYLHDALPISERKKRDEIEAGKSYCSRRFGGATCDDKSAQIYARFDKNDWRIQPAEFYRFHDAEVNTFGYF